MFPLSRLLLAAAVTFSLGSFTAAAAEGSQPRTTGKWELVEDTIDGDPWCLLMGNADQSTIMILKMEASNVARGTMALMFMNMDWSIKAHDDLGTVGLYTDTESLVGNPITSDRGFIVRADADAVERWVRSGSKGFWIQREGKVIARYAIGDLPTKIVELRRCGAKLYERNPFAN